MMLGGTINQFKKNENEKEQDYKRHAHSDVRISRY
nr:MAG TPA: hypothetical protein [Caudoviricetes sp.]